MRVQEKYDLPDDIHFCVKCTVSNQRPRIKFDENGVCSACRYAEYKQKQINWDLREAELIMLCDKYRKGNGDYDVIVPCSGGKDSGFVAHQLKHKYGMTPLTVTWAPLKATEIGRRNLDALIDSGLDNLYGKPNGIVTRKLCAIATAQLGEPFQPFIYGQTNFPLQISVKYNIPLIMYGENGEVEYGGDMKNALRPDREITDHDRHYFSDMPPEFMREIDEKDLKPFMAPPAAEIVKAQTAIHFFGYYKYWDPQENYYYCAEHTGFEPNGERNEGTYSKYASIDDCLDGFHYYMGFLKFGIGRCTSDAAQEIRSGKIDRDEGIALVKKYDGEFPAKYYDEFLDYISVFGNIDNQKFETMMDDFRSPHIWTHAKDGWHLRNPIWQSAR